MSNDAEFIALLDECYNEFSRNQGTLYTKWDFEGCRSWELLTEAGAVGFTRDDGSFIVADIQILGSFVRTENLWVWGWNHEEMEDALKVDALTVKAYGEEHGYEALTTGAFDADAMMAGALTALSVRLTGSQGVWEGVDGGLSVMFALRNIRHAAQLP